METKMLSLNEARRMIRAAEDEAARQGYAVNIAVLDSGGHVIAHVRMDGAWLAGVDQAINKAYTACAFGIATRDLAGAVCAGEGCECASGLGSGKRIVLGAGGLPIRCDGRIVGTIGVSGSTEYGNEAIAEAGARALTGEYRTWGLRPSLRAEPGVRQNALSQIARLGNRSGISPQPCQQPALF
jgi:uncharacterized protein GlcG (DUF336 family)